MSLRSVALRSAGPAAEVRQTRADHRRVPERGGTPRLEELMGGVSAYSLPAGSRIKL